MFLIEFPPETDWLEIKKIVSVHEKEYVFVFDSTSIWRKDNKPFLCFRGLSK